MRKTNFANYLPGVSTLAAIALALSIVPCAIGTPPPSVTTASSPNRAFRQGARSVKSGQCSSSSDCNDGRACTADICSSGSCLNIPITDCIECSPRYNCGTVEIVFIMDTSGSMRDEAEALCSGMQTLIDELAAQNLTVLPHFLGITTVGEGFPCLTGTVIDPPWNGTVPGTLAGTCPFGPDVFSAYESWGPATAIVAKYFNWQVGPNDPEHPGTRVIIPMSDEAACNGSRPEGCEDPGPDRDAALNAANVALENGVIVSPIMGTGTDSCVLGLANTLATFTGGQLFQSKQPLADMVESIRYIATSVCTVDDSCNDGHSCTADDHCVDGVCIGTPILGCRQCKTSTGCNDNNACTNDACQGGICVWSANFDSDLYCCNPISRNLAPKDDGDPCTLDLCDPVTGKVDHPPSLAGVPCDDGEDCTIHDSCNGEGACEGVDVSSVTCATDTQCFGHTCDLASQTCVCGEIPSLCLRVEPDGTLQDSCHQEGEDIVFHVELGNSVNTISGGQFRLLFDADVLEFVDAAPGADSDPHSPFSLELFRALDAGQGAFFYAVSIPLGGHGTKGPTTMATLRFRGIRTCSEAVPCFVDSNPQHTTLSDDHGRPVRFAPCCESGVKIHGADPVLTCPSSIVTQADPGSIAATVSWDPPAATGECDGLLQLSCKAQNNFGAPVSSLIQHGGLAPTGSTHFSCETVDTCGAPSACAWDVVVEDANAVQVSVQLSPTMSQGPVERCIEFSFYSDCFKPPVVVEQNVSFGFPFSLPGRADNVSLQVPPGLYTCVSARDAKHTLRSTAPLTIVGNKYKTSFLGDPSLGGNWLRNGNLDGNGVIDSVDQAILLSMYSASVQRNSPCGTTGFHADINGDGAVNANDLVFIQRNFLAADMATCCPNVVADAATEGRPSISIAAARRMGLGDLSFADVNHDGLLSLEDVNAIITRDLLNSSSTPNNP